MSNVLVRMSPLNMGFLGVDPERFVCTEDDYLAQRAALEDMRPKFKHTLDVNAKLISALEEARAAMGKADDLLDEVYRAHRDPDDHGYNECEKPGEECMWCSGVDAYRARLATLDRLLSAGGEGA